ncbi:DUF397 domain-containing protein [Actinomycetospora rhizophila]|uniref:DUF397 domain-containing protein n=1 Tax=Actinomycetospora rhizophila TaxID=1416876 RepID=A0ABV9ZDP5_9PSEU
MTASPPSADPSVRTSSFCSDGACVGVAIEGDAVRVVDTKSSAALRFTPAEWAAFVAGVKAGEFDLPR